MRNDVRSTVRVQFPLYANLVLALLSALLLNAQVFGQLSDNTDLNVSKKNNDDQECAIAKSLQDNDKLFMACNSSGPGLLVASSNDSGRTWTKSVLADGTNPSIPAACCDPSLAWDRHGNLYLGYLNEDPSPGPGNTSFTRFVILISVDGGQTFALLKEFSTSLPLRLDRPKVVTANTAPSTAGTLSWVWAAWHEKTGAQYQMRANGARVSGMATISGGVVTGVDFLLSSFTIPGTDNCMAGDIAIAPKGAVVAVCQKFVAAQGPSQILVSRNLDPFGLLGPPRTFTTAQLVTSTNVGLADLVPAVGNYSVDAAVGLIYDSNGPIADFPKHPGYPEASPHFGRLYMVYTDEVLNAGVETNDTNIMLLYSDTDGAAWNPTPIRVNQDSSVKSQILPRIASNALSGNLAICWQDARNSPLNNSVQTYCTIATPGTQASPANPLNFLGDWLVSDAASSSTAGGSGYFPDIKFGDYTGLAYFQGIVHPAWADTSNSTGDNPDNNGGFDAYTDRVSGGNTANEGDPHITTFDGAHYDFQGAGEYVALRGDALEVQLRQTGISTTFNPGANPHTGLATCVSLNTAVAAKVGTHRVTYQPNVSGVPDPTGMQLRVDGILTSLGQDGIDLGTSGRIMRTAVPGGVEITFPSEATMIVTPGWWESQEKWYLNVNVYGGLATQGLMGAIPRESWIPPLPDGTSLGPMPVALHDRYMVLYKKFGNAWRVTDTSSLFDYAPGTSTATFTVDTWPNETPPCNFPSTKPVKPLDPDLAAKLCKPVLGKNRNANCVFDVTITGEPGFARTYLETQRFEAGATMTMITARKDATRHKEGVTFAATVARKLSRGSAPRGHVQLSLDGSDVGEPVKLDSNGLATWNMPTLKPGKYHVKARYVPGEGSFLPSESSTRQYVVTREP